MFVILHVSECALHSNKEWKKMWFVKVLAAVFASSVR